MQKPALSLLVNERIFFTLFVSACFVLQIQCIPKPTPNIQGVLTIFAANQTPVDNSFRVITTSPSNNETGVLRFSSIAITFSNQISSASLQGSLDFQQPVGSNRITSLVSSITSSRLTLRPNNSFESLGRYSLTIRTTLQDTTGQALQSPFTFSFTAAQ